MWFSFGLVALLATGCGEADDGRPDAWSSLDSGLEGIGMDDDGDDEGESSDEGDPLDPPEPSLPTDSCFAVDLLFVIDNSGSMCDAQEQLAAVAPQLVDAMFDSLPRGTDLHLGIVTTSFSNGGQHQETECRAAEGPATIQDAYVTDTLVDENGYQGRLFEHDGQRYVAARTHDDDARQEVADWFSSALVDVGCSGGAFEFPAAAAAYAVDPVNAEANAGFLRDEGAALAIFVLTNETDQSPEGLATYRDKILDAKAGCGGESCVVTAGLLPPNCVPAYDPFVWQFLNAFGKVPIWGDIAEHGVYGEVVAETLTEGLVQTCEDIEPVG